MPGLGKSFLGNAIAYDALSRGIDAERVTAYAFIQTVLQIFGSRRSAPRAIKACRCWCWTI